MVQGFYDARQGLLLPNFADSISSGMKTGMQLREAQREIDTRQQLGALSPQIAAGDMGAINQALALDPTGAGFKGALLMREQGRSDAAAAAQKKQDFLAKSAIQLANTPKEQKDAVYQDLQRIGVQMGIITPEEIEPYTPELERELNAYLTQSRDIEKMLERPEATALERQIQAMGYKPGTKEYQDALREAVLKPSTQINIGDKGKGELEKIRAERVAESEVAGEAASNVKYLVESAREKLKEGAFTGPLSGAKTLAAEFGEAFNLPIDKEFLRKAENSREIEKAFAKAILPEVKKLGSNPSNADRDFAIKTIGDVTQGKGSIIDALDTLQALSEVSEKVGAVPFRDDMFDATASEIAKEQNRIRKEFNIKDRLEEIRQERLALETLRKRPENAAVDEVRPVEIYEEGTIAVNPDTGEKIILRNGEWVPYAR